MFTILIILCWIAVVLIYTLQFQIVKDYKPYIGIHCRFNRTRVHSYGCRLERESIFKWRKVQ